MPSVMRTVGKGQNLNFNSPVAKASKKMGKLSADRRAMCLLAAAGAVTALLPGVGHAQTLAIPTPYLDITANDFNVVSGLLTPNIAPSGLLVTAQASSGGVPTLSTNATANGAEAITFSGNNYFQFNTSTGRDVLTSGTGITIVAYVKPSSSSVGGAFVGGATGALQYRLDSGSNVQAVLRGGVTHYGNSNTTVAGGVFSTVAAAMPTGSSGTVNFFLNGNTDGTATIPSSNALTVGFDQFGGRDNGNASQEEFGGQIVELAVYNAVLSTAQVEQVQNQMATNYTSTTQLYYSNGSNTFNNGSTSFTTIGGAAATYANGTNSVVFGDTVAGGQTPISNPNIVIAAGGISPTAVTFNDNSLNYSLTDADGTNGISGSGGITKNWGGTLTFNSSNQFTGPVILGGGNTVLAANGAIDTASAITVGTGASLTVQPGIALGGATNVNLAGGTLALSSGASFTSTGGVSVNGGTLLLNSGYTPLGAAIPITLNSNGNNIPSILFNQSSPTSNTTFAPTAISMPSTSSFNVSQGNVTVTGNISGAGGLLVNHAGLVTLAGSNTYTGTTLINHGALQLTGTYAPAGNTSNLSFSNGGNTNTLIVNGGTSTFPSLTRVDMGSGTNTVSNLVVNAGTLNVAASVTVSDDNYAELTVNGGTANLTGVLTLSYPNGQASSINVLSGTLATTSSLEGITVGNRGHSAAINLDGGTLLASTINGNNNPVGVLNFNGGTLKANSSTGGLVSAIGNAFIYSGGATVDDGGNTVTLPQSLSNPIGAGLTSIAVTTPGTGYSYVPTVRITGGTVLTGGVGASAIAIYNAATGQVTGVQITNPGNYSSTTGLAFQFSSQAGATTPVSPTVTYTSATNTSGAFNKAGTGTLVLSGNSTYTGPTNVLAGTLRVTSPGPLVPIVNGSFDTPVTTTLGANGYQFGSGTGQPITLTPANSGWTYSGNYAGITNGAGYAEDGTTPVGTGQYAFLQRNGSISQTTTFPATANYILSYFVDSRIQGGQPDAQTIAVELNGNNISNGAVSAGVTWSQQTIVFPANAGSNTLTFQGLNPNAGVDQTMLINGVAINEVGGTAASTAIPSVSQVNVTSGATLDVFNSTITIGSLTGPGNVTLGTGALSVGGDNSTNSNFSGVISGTGSLTKLGTGTQLLTGVNTYTGPTTVTMGTLAVGAGTVLVSPTIAVGNGGIFATKLAAGGTSTYAGTIAVGPGGGLSMVDGNIGTLSLTSTSSPVLTLGSVGSSVPASLGFEISSAGVDTVNVSGAVSAVSPVSVTLVGIGASNLNVGNYTLVTATGGLGTSKYFLGVNAIAVNGEGYGLSLANSTSTSEIVSVTDLGAALATAYWTGTQGAMWGTNNSGGTNWATDATGASDTHAIPSAFTNVYFTVASGGANLATSLSSNQSINSITFNGNASGPVSISGYTLSIGAASIGGNVTGNGLNMASGSTAVTINSNVALVNSQTWTNSSTNPLTINGSIGGIASLTQAGPGLIVLAGNNTFNGGYNLSAGTLNINNNGALGTGNFAINSATTLDNTSGSTVNLVANNTQSWNSDFTFTGTNNLNMGNGTVTMSASRTINVNAGSLTVGGLSDSGQVYSLTTAGNGNLSLSGSSTYKGTTAIHNGSSLSFVGAGGYSGGGTLVLTPGSSTSTVSVNFNSTGLVSFGTSQIQLGNAPGLSVFNMSSGTVNSSFGILSAINGGTVLMNITGGTLNTGLGSIPGTGGQPGNFEFGNGGLAVLNQSGGNINVTGGEGSDVLLSTFAPNATFNITGGNFQTAGGMAVGYRNAGYVNVSGTGHLSVAGTLTLGIVAGAGGLNANGVGYLNISNGGIVTTNTLNHSGNGGFINFDGGTLQATANTTTILSGFSTGTVNALAGGAIFDTNGFNVTVTSPIVSPAGVIGGVTKVGAGTLILTANNGYSGKTTVSAGTLQLPLLNNGAVGNYNFAIPANSGGADYAPNAVAGVAWTFSADGGAAPLGAGVTNGTAFTFNGTPPGGSGQAAFVQENGYFSQSINFPTTGTYTLSFATEQRATGNGSFEDLDVLIDNPNSGGQDLYGTPSELTAPGVAWTTETLNVSVTAGSHLLTFEGFNPQGDDSTAYIANVALTGGGLSGTSSIIPSTSPVVVADNAVFDTNNDSQQIGSLAGTSLASVLVEAGTLTIGNDNTDTTYAGAITGAGALAKVGTGTQIFSGSNNYSGGTNVSGGKLVFAAPGAFPLFTSLTVGPGAIAKAGFHNASSPRNTLFVTGLSISGTTGAWTGTVDLANNDLVIRNGSFAQTLDQVTQGYAGGTWQGSGGITSTAAAISTTHLTALAVVQNSMDGTPTGNAIFTTFDGQTVTDADVLVKYTYYGDANLDGQVDGTDYSRIDNGVLMGLTGWYNGDFNYDGVIDGSDYTLIDNSYNQQGASLAAAVASPTAQVAGSSVPEPASLSLLALGAVGLLGRRRAARHHN